MHHQDTKYPFSRDRSGCRLVQKQMSSSFQAKDKLKIHQAVQFCKVLKIITFISFNLVQYLSPCIKEEKNLTTEG